MNQAEVGRWIGGLGALAAAVGWSWLIVLTVFGFVQSHFIRLLMLALWPVVALAVMFAALSLRTAIVLARRADTTMPSRMTVAYLVLAALAALFARFQLPQLWLSGVLLAIAATQLIAVWCCESPSPTK